MCHLDVNSIDPEIVPAVNFPEQGGLTLEEVKALSGAVQKMSKFKVFELAGYNPRLDPNHACVAKLVELVCVIFSQKTTI
jgi:arginase